MKYISNMIAIIIWVIFLYVAIAAIIFHLLPHLISWELDQKLVIFILLDLAILQLLSWIYKKLPFKPKNIAFSWLEKVSLF